jgi:hypothetical protein
MDTYTLREALAVLQLETMDMERLSTFLILVTYSFLLVLLSVCALIHLATLV